MFVGLCWGLFVLLFEDIRLFAFHLFSYKLRIVDRLQNVDDRQSLERARHGLKKKIFLILGRRLPISSQVFSNQLAFPSPCAKLERTIGVSLFGSYFFFRCYAWELPIFTTSLVRLECGQKGDCLQIKKIATKIVH